MMAFASGTQNYFLVKNRIWESIAMLLIAFSLIRPGFWLDKFQEPYLNVPFENLTETILEQPDNQMMRFKFRGENFAGEEVERSVLLSIGEKEDDGKSRLKENTGLVLAMEGEKMLIDDISFGSKAQQTGIDFGWELLWAQVEAERMAKQWFYLPAFCFLWLIWFIQRMRLKTELLRT